MAAIKQELYNPLYGYRIKHITSCSARSEVLVVKNSSFRQFVSINSPLSQITESQLRDTVEKEFGLNGCSVRYKYQFFNLMHLKQIERNEILLKANTVPNEVYCVISGEV